jgi:hypothetical protein
MESWNRDRLTHSEIVMLSDPGFINNKIADRFSDHFIERSEAGPDRPYKPLLIDSHGSHLISEFILGARTNNVVLFWFLPHLIHCMQPCDAGMFQSYKYRHNKFIGRALESFDFDYTVLSFFRDFYRIDYETFKFSTIKVYLLRQGYCRLMLGLYVKTCSNTWKSQLPDLLAYRLYLTPKHHLQLESFELNWKGYITNFLIY